ncbi:hypothetical protein [Kitasatospora sp. NPDC059571]|uniref:hypothetical protein n=1 Tax=Kitasatospora sp. NPDC059571 TaxID=3346871 RepID=UPI0036803537
MAAPDAPSAEDSYTCRYGWTRGTARAAAGSGLIAAAALGKLLFAAGGTPETVCFALAAAGSLLSTALVAGVATARRVALRIGPEGILLGTPVRHLGRPVLVPWEEVAAVEVRGTAAPVVRVRRRTAPTVQRALGTVAAVDGERVRGAVARHAPGVLPIVSGPTPPRS